jgi:hypothetical protein
VSLNRLHLILVAAWLISLVVITGFLLGPGMPSTLPQTIAVLALGSIPVVVLLVVFRGAPPRTIAQVLYDTDRTASDLARRRLFERRAKESMRSDDNAMSGHS